ncbi:MAG: hypothetical protein EXR75_07280 [Myxococcales bacterium]|nr:hypothetical protein [Myxococcales bacterium]
MGGGGPQGGGVRGGGLGGGVGGGVGGGAGVGVDGQEQLTRDGGEDASGVQLAVLEHRGVQRRHTAPVSSFEPTVELDEVGVFEGLGAAFGCGELDEREGSGAGDERVGPSGGDRE